MSTGTQEILVVGGTGMLKPAVDQLLVSGTSVFVVARNPHRATPDNKTSGVFTPVRGDWERPSELVDAVLEATGGRRLPTLVFWAHSPHRFPLIKELDRALEPPATVVRIWGSATRDPRMALSHDEHVLENHNVRDVVLGYEQTAGRNRWLTNGEISDGVLKSLAEDTSMQVVGKIDPWKLHP